MPQQKTVMKLLKKELKIFLNNKIIAEVGLSITF